MRQFLSAPSWMVLVLAGVALAACGNGGSAVETRDRSAETSAATHEIVALAEMPVEGAALGAAPTAPVAKTVLTGNRRETADDKAVRLYERNGRDFGASSPDDYLAKAMAFTSKPPADAEKISRPNGDVLIYQASSNTFAVVDRRGVIRTMFKPSTGQAYWQDQKAKAPSFGR